MGVGGTAIQRIRYGLTGLAFVFLAVLIGTAITSNEEKPTDPQANNIVESPSDPLAELGVAPDSGPENVAAPPARR